MKRLIPFVGIIGLVAFVFYSFLPRRMVEEQELTLHQAVHEHQLGLPSSASNILFATASVGIGGRAMIYRFSSPVSNMLAHIEFLNSTLDYRPDECTPPPCTAITPPVDVPLLKAYGPDRLKWFDVENIQTGFVSHAGGYNSTI